MTEANARANEQELDDHNLRLIQLENKVGFHNKVIMGLGGLILTGVAITVMKTIGLQVGM